MAPTAEQVRVARDSGDLLTALRLSCEAWRVYRSAEIAAIIEQLSALATPAFDAPKARASTAFHAAWLQIAEEAAPDDPLVTGWLVSTFRTKLPIDAKYGGFLEDGYVLRKYAAVIARVQALSTRAPDPRVASALLDHVGAGTWSVVSLGDADLLYGPMLEVIASVGDPRSHETLARLTQDPPATTATIRDFLINVVPAKELGLATAPSAMCPDLGDWRALGPRNHEVDASARRALLSEVHGALDDDEPRLVYADMLQADGDEHGELIALQIANTRASLTKKDQTRIRKLLQQHQARWMGEALARVTVGEFERGFLARIMLKQNSAAPEHVWEEASQAPALATVTELRLGRGNWAHYERFALSDRCKQLTYVEVGTPRLLERLVAITDARSYRTLNLHTLRSVIKRLPAVGAATAFRQVVHLETTANGRPLPQLIAALRDCGLLERLHTLQVSDTASDDPVELLAMWPSMPATMSSLAFGWRGDVALTRTPDGVQLHCSWHESERTRILAALPRGIVTASN